MALSDVEMSADSQGRRVDPVRRFERAAPVLERRASIAFRACCGRKSVVEVRDLTCVARVEGNLQPAFEHDEGLVDPAEVGERKATLPQEVDVAQVPG